MNDDQLLNEMDREHFRSLNKYYDPPIKTGEGIIVDIFRRTTKQGNPFLQVLIEHHKNKQPQSYQLFDELLFKLIDLNKHIEFDYIEANNFNKIIDIKG